MNKQKVHLVFISKLLYGGWRVYTSHMAKALRIVGLEPIIHIHKKGTKTENFTRDFQYSNERYYNDDHDSCIRLAKGNDPVVVVCFDKNHDDLAIAMHMAGAYLVMHDEDEFSTRQLMDYLPEHVDLGNRIITGRKNSLYKRGAALVPYPYVPNPDKPLTSKVWAKMADWKEAKLDWACSTCRIDSDKRTEIILAANLRLRECKRIAINGYDGRVHGRKVLAPKYPNYEMSSYRFPPASLYAGEDICRGHMFSVDMSSMTGDGAGGGVQYSFMEAMAAGTPIIVHKDWLRPNGEMRDYQNCYAVAGEDDLVDLLSGEIKFDVKHYATVVRNGLTTVKRHSGRRVGNAFKKLVGI